MSTKINTSNYEAFVLDYMEGTLSQNDVALLKTFVLTHPELDIDLADTELVSLEIDKAVFSHKENLKKTSPLISEEQFVEYIENNLTSEEKTELEKTIAADTFLQKELELYKRTVLSADNTILFENKASLKRKTRVLWFQNTSYLSMAAALILIFGLWFIFKDSLTSDETNKNNLSLVKNTPEVTVPVTKKEIAPLKNTVEITNEASNQLATNPSTATLIKKKSKNEPILNTIEPIITNNIPNLVANNNAPIKQLEITPNKKDTIQNSYAANSKPTTPGFIVAQGKDEDEAITPKVENKGLWALAGKALHNLNKLGVKKVNGAEAIETNKEQYVLSLGNFSIKQNKYTQN